jgi:hypothetical protein
MINGRGSEYGFKRSIIQTIPAQTLHRFSPWQQIIDSGFRVCCETLRQDNQQMADDLFRFRPLAFAVSMTP